MTEISDRYRQRADQFEQKIRSVSPEGWSGQSPCPEWDARDVLKHVVDSTNHFLGWVDRASTDTPSVDDDPVGAFQRTRAAVQECLDDPAIAGQVVERPMGTNRFDWFVDQYLTFDLLVHAWDIATGAGIDDTLDLRMVEEEVEKAGAMAEVGRTMGAFGEEVAVPTDADPQTRLLATVGRRR